MNNTYSLAAYFQNNLYNNNFLYFKREREKERQRLYVHVFLIYLWIISCRFIVLVKYSKIFNIYANVIWLSWVIMYVCSIYIPEPQWINRFEGIRELMKLYEFFGCHRLCQQKNSVKNKTKSRYKRIKKFHWFQIEMVINLLKI